MSEPGQTKKSELKVFIASRESKCDDCGEELGRHAWITLQQEKGAVCLTCADLDHLVYLPSGDAALTRRARKNSRLSARHRPHIHALPVQWPRSQPVVPAARSACGPGCPSERETIIAEHACRKYSGRVGRSAAAKDLAEKAVQLAVLAHIRHVETRYDEFLIKKCDRHTARARVSEEVFQIEDPWRKKA